jgi:hypothetical protein
MLNENFSRRKVPKKSSARQVNQVSKVADGPFLAWSETWVSTTTSASSQTARDGIKAKLTPDIELSNPQVYSILYTSTRTSKHGE